MTREDVRPGMKVRVLRNTCMARMICPSLGENRPLKPDDIVTLTGDFMVRKVSNWHPGFNSRHPVFDTGKKGWDHYILIEDIEPVESETVLFYLM
jgi:hypothetical protein